MKVRYTFRCYPTDAQAQELSRVFGHSRFVYNWCLRLRTDAWANGERINYNQSSAALTALKRTPEHQWLNEVSCVPLQQSLRNLQTAFGNFFSGRAKYPRFKGKRDKQSAEYTTSAFKYSDRVLSLAKIGRLKVRWSRPFLSSPTTVTISKTCTGRYYVSLVLDEQPHRFEKTGESVGVDLGINRLATLSNGERIPNLKFTRTYEKKLAKAQKSLSRKTKGSGRWNRQRIRVARLHEKLTNARIDHLNKVTTDLVRRFDVVAVEDLNVRGMVRNRKLAKHLSDASFGRFVSMLEYKCAWRGKELVKIDRFFPSSKRCSCCGYVAQTMPLNVRNWYCQECHTEHDRDENAAQNILNFALGQRVNAHGATVSL
ncbi:putative 45,4 kDa protein in snaA-snaB intergenic region ORF401 [Fibrella aestuarina BUZ 2]|uniref:Putative 45,4 kDa protein in snaA-snaB intergenic region ORF401 n=1 Tax=Fibrella aestuarina BUZ 2 TaxID=1166018 RepID=I0KCV5_9BACT|nr:RNA-guided endonuclease TnpB family protein [Fibrella aestuarina]CCH01958.1 putative 45,4 kDa protein in snaA-snaB intergenic region ORF401 [Fibrella aestuarina BUZ 2]